MKRLLGLVLVITMIPAGSALAADLEELLERSGEASYSAEQLITCNTPDGTRDALIELKQSSGELRYSGVHDSDVEVSSGFGAWSVQSGGSLIQPEPEDEERLLVTAAPTYSVDDGSRVIFLGRPATAYQLERDGLIRAELIVDNAVGVLVSVTSFDVDGNIYCQRRFVSFDPTTPTWSPWPAGDDVASIEPSEAAGFPERLDGFRRLDLYQDESGLSFAYYSDGFFSFAVFDSPSQVVLDDGSEYETEGSVYQRQFNPGQVTYAWTAADGYMALTGDLPPDMHDAVLSGLERPYDPGLFRRLWRRIFG